MSIINRYYKQVVSCSLIQLLLVVLTLQMVMLAGEETLFGKIFFVIHLGLYIIWQPFVYKEMEVSNKQLLVLSLLLMSMVIFLNSWTLSIWILLVLGTASGAVEYEGESSKPYLLLFAVLFWDLVMVSIPGAIGEKIFGERATIFMHVSLLLIPLSMLMFLKKRALQPISDIFQCFNAIFIVSFIVMGVLLAHAYFELSYLLALVVWLLAVGVTILMIFWFLYPNLKVNGVQFVIENYLLKMSFSTEGWLNHVIDLAYNSKLDPENFIEIASKELIKIPWISGLAWHEQEMSLLIGSVSRYRIEHEGLGQSYVLYAVKNVSPTQLFHGKWLLKLLNLLLVAKIREQRLAQQRQLKAIYETGAKLTHDIKNILQAVNTMMEFVDAVEDQEGMVVIRRQLPALSQRLTHTLDKLQAPTADKSTLVSIFDWWTLVKARYAGRDIDFEDAEMQRDDMLQRIDDQNGNKINAVYIDVLDSVVENLLENARYKRQESFVKYREREGRLSSEQNPPVIHITASLVMEEERFLVSVTDSGDPMPEAKERLIFKQAIESKRGYGIGLYQSAKMAAKYGYQFTLNENRKGCVQFTLTGDLKSYEVNE